MSKKKFFITGLGNFHPVGNGGSTPSGDYYTKAEIDAIVNNIYSIIDNKTSAEAHYQLNKTQLKSGNYINLLTNDNDKTITFNQTDTPKPTRPNSGIVSYNANNNEWLIYDASTIFSSNAEIKAVGATSGNNYSFSRSTFNEPELYLNNDVQQQDHFLENCINFNQPLNLSNMLGNQIKNGFLFGCEKFNSEIIFNSIVTEIGDGFMGGCLLFNKKLDTLITNHLQKIGHGFLQGCKTFNQDLPFQQATFLWSIGNYFLSQCESLNKVVDLSYCNSLTANPLGFCFNLKNNTMLIKLTTTQFYSMVGGQDPVNLMYSFGTTDSSSPVYVVGLHINIAPISGSIITKQIFDQYFPDSNESVYRKTIITNN